MSAGYAWRSNRDTFCSRSPIRLATHIPAARVKIRGLTLKTLAALAQIVRDGQIELHGDAVEQQTDRRFTCWVPAPVLDSRRRRVKSMESRVRCGWSNQVNPHGRVRQSTNVPGAVHLSSAWIRDRQE